MALVPVHDEGPRDGPYGATGGLVGRLRMLVAEAPPSVVAMWLFGSRARGDERADSDVDLAALFREPPAPTLGNAAHELEARLEDALGLPVQVVVANSAPPDLVHRVLRDGTLLVDRDPGFRTRFEVRMRNELFDVEPFVRRYRTGRG